MQLKTSFTLAFFTLSLSSVLAASLFERAVNQCVLGGKHINDHCEDQNNKLFACGDHRVVSVYPILDPFSSLPSQETKLRVDTQLFFENFVG